MHAIQNFNIPVINFDRAHQFYSRLLGYELQRMEFNGIKLGIFNFDKKKGGVGGALICDSSSKPSMEGTIVYLDTGNNLQENLDNMKMENMTIMVPKTALGPNMGFFSIIIDSEGNKVGLYSRN